MEQKDSYINVTAITDEQKHDVYTLRYNSYIADNSIEPNASGLFKDNFDNLENTQSYLTYKDNELIGTIRTCVYNPSKGWTQTPSLLNYKDDIKKHIGLNKVIVESSRFCIKPEYRKKSTTSKLYLFKNIFNKAKEHEADYIITTVKSSQQKLYKSMFFKTISKEKPYPGVNFKTVLMTCNIKDVYKKYNDNKNDSMFNALHKIIMG